MDERSGNPEAKRSTVIAIDPGRVKCGMAVVAGGRGLEPETLREQVVATGDLLVRLADLLRQFPDSAAVILGNGTQSRVLRRAITDMFPNVVLSLVEEHGSSQRARARYIAENPPKGWQRLLPAGLRTPDRPYDDVVARLLAEEFLLNQ